MGFGLGEILCVIWTATAVPLIVKGFGWLGRKINLIKAAEKSQIDEQILHALAVGISNVGKEFTEAARQDLEKGKLSKTEWRAICRRARDKAYREATEILDGPAREALAGKSDLAIDILIRHIVDHQGD